MGITYYPDEDAVEQGLRSQEQVEVADGVLGPFPNHHGCHASTRLIYEVSRNARNAAIKEHMDELQFLWALQHCRYLGTACYQDGYQGSGSAPLRCGSHILECQNLALAWTYHKHRQLLYCEAEVQGEQ
jgi:hypothetical protein